MTEEEMERICFNCNYFFPDTLDEATEYGICLKDEAFEPYLDDILDGPSLESCGHLINKKRFTGDHEVCPDYEQSEICEIEDDSPLGRVLLKIADTGEIDAEALEMAAMEDHIGNIDWATYPVERYVRNIDHPDFHERDSAISMLRYLASMGNIAALDELLNHFKSLPTPKTLAEVHNKKDYLFQIAGLEKRYQLIPHLIEELYNIPSNNTTRQYISEIFRFLSLCPKNHIREPLETMLKDKRFSYRLKQKIKNILIEG